MNYLERKEICEILEKEKFYVNLEFMQKIMYQLAGEHAKELLEDTIENLRETIDTLAESNYIDEDEIEEEMNKIEESIKKIKEVISKNRNKMDEELKELTIKLNSTEGEKNDK